MKLSEAKRYLLTGTAGAVAPMLGMAGGSVATAADMAVKAPPAPPPVVASWTGCYIGGNIGVAGEHNNFNDREDLRFDPQPTAALNGSAFIGGGQAGCNWQTGKWVFGIEGDYSGLTNPNTTYFGQGPTNFNDTYGSHVSWMATARGRAGVTIDDGRTMLYLTGGAAWGGIRAGNTDDGRQETLDFSTTRLGWVAGGGVERIIFPHWTLGVEGLYADFGTYTAASAGTGKCCATVHDRVMIGRVKLNFKF